MLSLRLPPRSNLRVAFLLSAILLSFCGSVSCGKIGDPLPPIPRASLIVRDLAASQRGTQVRLSFPLARAQAVPQVERVDIYRLIEPVSAPVGVTETDFASRSTLIASIPGTDIPVGRTAITYDDSVELATKDKLERYLYAVRIVDRSGRSGELSNYAPIVPLGEIARPAESLQARVSQFEVEITWKPPAANESGSSPANIAGYNLYRRTGEAISKMNTQPLTEPRYGERSFQFGETYEYFVRVLSLPPGSSNPQDAIESNDSQPLTLVPKDTFAPAAPDSIKIASINKIVSLFWPSNAEPDLAGYNVYRSEDESLPAERWVKLTPRLLNTTTFRDERVEVGKRYFYQLTAVDNAGNESPRSAVVSEIVNP